MRRWQQFATAVAATAGVATAVAGVARRTARNLATARFDPAAPTALEFPAGFRFGAATSAHQVEGGTVNNWTRWEEHVRPDGRSGILTGERCGQAADHWRRFERDVTLMTELGLDAYRFSVEWSRVEPAEGQFDEGALDRYREWCEQLLAAGIEPVVTLHHFTEPLWITEQGGWENPSTVVAFARFVERVALRLGDVVDTWITINEPAIYAVMGWWRGEFPPGKHDLRLAGRVLEHLLLAHARAYHLLHEHARAGADTACRVSLAKAVVPFQPRRGWHPADVVAARLAHRLFNAAPLDACTTGRLRLTVAPGLGVEVEHPELAGTLDFVGVNHYFRMLVAAGPGVADGFETGFDATSPKNDMGWDLLPYTLADAVRFAAGYGKPVWVTEHGTCDAEEPDRRRMAFLLDSLHALADAAADGVDVRAYLHWSLLDNFEWAHGYAPRFGLYAVDFATQQRRLRPGGALYRDVIAAHHARVGR